LPVGKNQKGKEEFAQRYFARGKKKEFAELDQGRYELWEHKSRPQSGKSVFMGLKSHIN